MSKTNFIGDPNLLLSQFTKSNISLWNRFVEKKMNTKNYTLMSGFYGKIITIIKI